jgi:hypothetical protein
METLLKDIHKKVPYGFACGSEISSANWNWRPYSFLFKQRKEKKSHCVRLDECGRCGKMMTCCFACFCCTGALSCTNSKFFLHQNSRFLWQFELWRWFLLYGDDSDTQVSDCHLSCRSYRKHHVSSPVMIQLRNVPSWSALWIRSKQVLVQSSHLSCVRMHGTHCWVTQDMFRS